MKLKRQKKGFTIVELVIVVAVIAVLSAVLIPTFVGLVNKAHVTADGTLVRELNNALAMDKELNGEHKTMQDALDATKEYGFDVSRISTKASENKILWDSVHGVFCYLQKDAAKVEYVPGSVKEGDELLAGDYRLWIISSTVDANYSTYLYNYEGNGIVETTKGLDVGNENVTSVTYTHTSSPAQNVVIRTNSASTTLTINAKDDTVNHHGNVGKVDAQKIDLEHCYNEFGTAAYIKVTEGKVVAKDGSKIAVVFANNTDSSKVAVAKEDNATIEKALTTVEAVDTANFAAHNLHLEYSADGINPYTAEQIEATGELSVASETGVQPQGMDYTAVVNLVGYNSLYEAIVAANAGDTVSLLKDEQKNIEAGTIKYCSLSPQTPKAAVLIDKSITINGFGHTFKTTLAVAIGISSSNVSVNIYDLIINAATSAVQLTEDITDVKINIDGSELDTGSSGYAFRTGNGTKDLDITISNSTLEGYSALTLRNSNSKIEIVNCDLRGKNEASAAASNNYAAIVFDGAAYAGHYNSTSPYHDTPGICGSNNTMVIINTKLSATTATSNSQVWLNMQYGAQNNIVNVDSLSIINPNATWHSTDEGQNNTVKINGVTIDATIGD